MRRSSRSVLRTTPPDQAHGIGAVRWPVRGAGLPRHSGSVGDAACGRKDAVMAERRQRHGVDGDPVVRCIDRDQQAAVIGACGCVSEMPESSKVLSNTPSGVVQARTKTVSKMSNENAETLCVRRNASAVAIVIPEFPHRYLEINVLACEIRRTIKKNLSVGFKIICTATDRLKKCVTFASMIRKKLPSAKSSRACFWRDTTEHPRAQRVRDFDWR